MSFINCIEMITLQIHLTGQTNAICRMIGIDLPAMDNM